MTLIVLRTGVHDLRGRSYRFLDASNDAVVTRVGAAGVNYVDALIVEGRYQMKPP